ncbi:hypothetical protein HZS_3112 [Henneguya salminicola]|nr:hypothetical protein HZS_3112 [Henneguya salminicola]
MDSQSLIYVGVLGSSCLIPCMLINDKNYSTSQTLSYLFRLNPTFLRSMICSIRSLEYKKYGSAILCQFLHSDIDQCIINVIGAIGYSRSILKNFGPSIVTNLIFCGQIWGIIGTILQYLRCRMLCGMKIKDNLIIKSAKKLISEKFITTRYSSDIGHALYDYFNEHLLIYGFDFPLCSIMGFNTVYQIFNLINDMFLYYNKKMSFFSLLMNTTFTIISIAFVSLTFLPQIKKCFKILSKDVNIDYLLLTKREPSKRYCLSTGRVSSLIYGASMAFILCISN